MRYRVADLLKAGVGSSRRVSISEESDLELPGMHLIAPLTGSLSLIRDPFGILAEVDLRSRAQAVCARCLRPAQVDLACRFDERFHPTVAMPSGVAIERVDPAEREPETDIDAQHVLDLAPVLAQHLQLAAPSLPLCKADCAGLCPECGTDLNEGSCDCEPAMDPRWAGLAELRDAEA